MWHLAYQIAPVANDAVAPFVVWTWIWIWRDAPGGTSR